MEACKTFAVLQHPHLADVTAPIVEFSRASACGSAVRPYAVAAL